MRTSKSSLCKSNEINTSVQKNINSRQIAVCNPFTYNTYEQRPV